MVSRINLYVAFVFCGILFVVDAYPEKRHVSCGTSYSKLGCYKDKHTKGHRPLPHLLFTDRNPRSYKSSAKRRIDWENLDTYMEDVVCRCAEQANAQGYMFFGLQFYGECWASKEFTFNIDGMGEGCMSSDYEPCTFSSRLCVGEEFSLFVYNVQQ